jgi:tRNA (adenine37-N6)-methyltransferase
MSNDRFQIQSLGTVRGGQGSWEIIIKPAYRDALIGLEGFSHVHVVFWLHLHDTPEDRKTVSCEKPYTKGPDVLGVFATRSDYRPNPIGLSICPVKSIDPEKGILEVWYIDAEDNTPVIDVKPYQPVTDRLQKVSVPRWCEHWPKWYEEAGEFDWAAEFNFPVS